MVTKFNPAICVFAFFFCQNCSVNSGNFVCHNRCFCRTAGGGPEHEGQPAIGPGPVARADARFDLRRGRYFPTSAQGHFRDVRDFNARLRLGRSDLQGSRRDFGGRTRLGKNVGRAKGGGKRGRPGDRVSVGAGRAAPLRTPGQRRVARRHRHQHGAQGRQVG